MAVEAIGKSARERQLNLQEACLGVVGATGNIGSTYSLVLAEEVGYLILFGTSTSKRRLQKLAARILYHAATQIRARGPHSCHGLAHSLASSPALLTKVLSLGDEDSIKSAMDELYRDFGLARILAVSTDLNDLRCCEIIVTASNESGAVIHPQHLSDSDVIICDLAVPRDTSPLIEIEKPHAHIIQGGIVRLPDNPDFSIGGIPLDRGRSFACMAETLLLGLEGIQENFSYGEITHDQVKKIGSLAAKHGFTLSEEKVIASL
jgi:predicted amino acid dehydrogenase